LVVYYSRAGKTKELAEELANRLGCDIEAVVDKRKRNGIHMLTSGRDAQKMSFTEIGQPANDPSAYDLVVIGTPVYSSRVSAPMRTYLTMNKDNIKKSAFFLTHMLKKNHAFEDMEAILSKEPIACLEIRRRRDLRAGTYEKKLGDFVEQIIAGIQESPMAAPARGANSDSSRNPVIGGRTHDPSRREDT
jgi:menaquinone-dependent protoporphyrinogen IX oxidase